MRKMLMQPAVAVLAALVPLPALAQPSTAVEENVFDGDYITIGAGVIYGPSYDGSDDYVLTPIPVVQGSFRGINITPRAGGVSLDFIPDGEDPQIGFSFGPIVTLNSNRRSNIEDPVVRAAGKLKRAIEVGPNIGVTFYEVLHGYDSITLSADIQWDINGAHKGRTISPGVTYFTPLSRAAMVMFSVGAKHVDDDYADYYYSVSPAQSAASGLPVFRADGGWDKFSIGVLGAYDLSGNALDGGFSIIGLATYSRMLNDAKETPYTSIRGDADQFSVGAGLAYTF